MPRRRLGIAWVLPLFLAAGRAVAADGDLDTLFGTNNDGIQKVSFDLGGAKTDDAAAIALTANGGIVLAGSAVTGNLPDAVDSAMVKLLADGTPDVFFGSGGSLHFDTDFAGKDDFLAAVGVLSNGDIVAAGGDTTLSGASVVKVSPTGTILDQRVFHFGSQVGFLALTVQPDDKIVLAGFLNRSANYAFLVMRLLPSLGRDPAFGNNGEVEIDFDLGASDDDDTAFAVALDHLGRILVCGDATVGNQDDDMAVARLLTNGQLDSSFSGDGKTDIAFDLGATEKRDHCRGVVADMANDVLLAGTATRDGSPSQVAVVQKLFPGGLADSSFGNSGNGGAILSGVVTDIDAGGAIAVQSDGIIAVGAGTPNVTGSFGAARLTANGSLDFNFGGGTGAVSYNVYNGPGDHPAAMAVQGGRILLAGSGEWISPDYDLAVMRLEATLIFYDGFETGDLSLWSKHSP
jgi:uncharacterized delta-60 repeat protein